MAKSTSEEALAPVQAGLNRPQWEESTQQCTGFCKRWWTKVRGSPRRESGKAGSLRGKQGETGTQGTVIIAFKDVKGYYVEMEYTGFGLFQWAELGSIDSNGYKNNFLTTTNMH